MTTEYDKAAFDMLVAMRGGLPERCDFCGHAYADGRYPVPEEAGAWACNECEAHWNADDRDAGT
jgi:hypothetical protein